MGHLFVAHGDLAKIACDALLIPCDEKLNVNAIWSPVLPPGLPTGDAPGWVRITGPQNGNGVVDLPDAGKRRVWAFAAPWSGYSEPHQSVDELWTALRDVIHRLVEAGFGPRLLIGIPLVGTGDGGLKTQRGEVVAKLLERHRSDPVDADLALVLLDRRDFAAVQNRRSAESDWSELDTELCSYADELGRLAGQGELSLFLGAGVSRPVGLPDWPGLLQMLADKAGIPCPSMENGLEEAATAIKLALGKRFEPEMVELLGSSEHAVGHALLAGLNTQQLVTTNFDTCMELALKAVWGDDFCVLAREFAEGGKPWLLKLHGDIEAPDSLVLDNDDVERHMVEGRALRGVVQSLMLTSHLLFVGFSFVDRDFLELAESVWLVRASAKCISKKPVGTALALTSADAENIKFDEIEKITMLESEPDKAARILEIFLDRLAWSAATNHDLSAEYLLDYRYESGLSGQDRALRKLLLKMVGGADQEAKSSPGWSRVRSCLRDLGMDFAVLDAAEVAFVPESDGPFLA